MKHRIPPLVESVEGGDVTWRRLEDLDFELLGYFLSCHLVLEHYVDHFLQGYSDRPFAWGKAKLTFGQKLSLLTGERFPEPWNPIPSLKHLNSLRNKFAHNISATLSKEDLLPLQEFLKKVMKGEGELPQEEREILETYTSLVGAFFAGSISRSARGIREP